MKDQFEQQMKRKLAQREIAPGANAWERVQLQRGRKPKKNYTLYYVAASGAALLALLWTINQRSGASFHPPATPSPVVTTPALPQQEQIADSIPAPAIVAPRIAKPRTPIAQSERRTAPETSAERVQDAISDAVTPLPAPIIITPALASVEPGAEIDYNDLDALIAKARMELAAGRGLSNPTDATSLLRDSESELERNFRHSVLEYLFKQKKIKLALDNK